MAAVCASTMASNTGEETANRVRFPLRLTLPHRAGGGPRHPRCGIARRLQQLRVVLAICGAEEHTTITGNSFRDDFTIPAGTAVVFVNDSGNNHTVTNGVSGVASEDALFDVELAAGETGDRSMFDEPGTYDVTCRIHSSMQLTITVE